VSFSIVARNSHVPFVHLHVVVLVDSYVELIFVTSFAM
jgi:hypothetical protein